MAATILESLKGVNAYPVPLRTLTRVIERRGLSQSDEATREVLRGAKYNLATADLLLWLADAPDISQGGQSFGFTDEQRLQFRNRAKNLLQEYGDAKEAEMNKPIYGYKGSRL